MVRVGRVSSVLRDRGMVVVVFEDRGSVSLPLPMLTFNNEVALPEVGEMVVTLHLENGSSKGFCLGTYYGEDLDTVKPYRKEFDEEAFLECDEGEYFLKNKSTSVESEEVTLSCKKGSITLTELLTRLENAEKKLEEHERRLSALEGGG